MWDDTPESRYVDGLLFPWEEAGSAEKPITTDEDEGFSEIMTPPAPLQTRRSAFYIEPSELSTAL